MAYPRLTGRFPCRTALSISVMQQRAAGRLLKQIAHDTGVSYNVVWRVLHLPEYR